MQRLTDKDCAIYANGQEFRILLNADDHVSQYLSTEHSISPARDIVLPLNWPNSQIIELSLCGSTLIVLTKMASNTSVLVNVLTMQVGNLD